MIPIRSLAACLLSIAVACDEPTSSQGPSTAPPAASTSTPERSSNAVTSASASASASAPIKGVERDFDLSGRGGMWGEEDPRRPTTAKIRMGATSVTGRLPPEVIQRIVRQSFGKLRLCYEVALAKDPTLAGRIATSFTIDTSGLPKAIKATGAIADKDMLACVEKTFLTLTFPTPESGMVKVIYPVVFAPPEYLFTINDKPSVRVEEVDVVKALEAAGYKVSGASSASQPVATVSRFKAEKAGVTFSITLDPAAKLPLDGYTKLKKEAALLQDGAWCLFVEASDKTAAQSLIDAIHKKLPAK